MSSAGIVMPHYRLQCDAGFSLSPFHKFYTPKWLTTTVKNTNNLLEARAEKESLCVDFKSKPIAFCIKILVHVQIEFVKNQRMPLKEKKNYITRNIWWELHGKKWMESINIW